MNIETRKLADLRPAAYNPRRKLQPGEPEYEKIARSIEEFGYCDPIIINKDGTIIGGHQRHQVLLDLGAESADVVVVDLDPDKEKALNVALNKITGSWDEAKLTELIGDLDMEGYDLSKTGYSDKELKAMLGANPDQAGGLQPGLHPPQPGTGPDPYHERDPPPGADRRHKGGYRHSPGGGRE